MNKTIRQLVTVTLIAGLLLPILSACSPDAQNTSNEQQNASEQQQTRSDSNNNRPSTGKTWWENYYTKDGKKVECLIYQSDAPAVPGMQNSGFSCDWVKFHQEYDSDK